MTVTAGGPAATAVSVGPSAQCTAPAERFVRHHALIGLSAGCAMAEAILLLLLAPAAVSLAPQVTALPPLAVFHDLRWLFGYNRSWVEFAAGALLLVLARSALDTALVRLAWPRGQQRPRLAATFSASLGFTLLAGLLLVPIVTLVFGVAVLPFSWPFLAAVPVLLAVTVPLSHGGVTLAWWRRLPPGRGAGWVIACFVEYSLLGIALPRLPAAGVVAAAGLAGVVNARAWYGLTTAMARPVRPRHYRLLGWIPVAPVAAVGVFAVAIGAARLIFDAAAAAPHVGIAAASSAGLAAAASSVGDLATPQSPVYARGQERAVLIIAGFGASCCRTGRGLQQAVPDMLVQQFSYLGLNRAGKPVPQGPAASNMPLPQLGDMIATQVQRLHAQTRQPVDLVAESEGTLGVYAAFARHPGLAAGSVVLLSPIVAPGQWTFPQDGQQGQAMAAGYALGVLDRLVGEMSPFGAAGADRLIDSVSRVGARYAAEAARGISRHWLALVPLADAVTLPACSLPQNVLVVPAFHGGLLGDPPVLGMVRDFLRDRPVDGGQGLREAAELLSSAAAAWRMPARSAPSPPCPAA
ncbi:MAG TPA: hypothetical protein VHY58_17580 [Streptosporangiaceae bacterium]|nr:hypothetical protein [Streptosporangiaceae bacterium]